MLVVLVVFVVVVVAVVVSDTLCRVCMSTARVRMQS